MTDEESSSFFVNAANEGTTELQLGEMAREKGMDPKTRNFGAALAREHADMINEVKKYSAQRNVVLPEAITPDNRKKIDELSLKPRKEFDPRMS
jgi:putative membrane protein